MIGDINPVDDKNQRDFFIQRVDLGYLRYESTDGLLIIKEPQKEVLYEALHLYNKYNTDNFDFNPLLFHFGLITEEEELAYKDLPKEIEDLKVDIYNNFKNGLLFRQKCKRKMLELERIISKKHQFDQYSSKGVANYIKNYHIIMNSTYKNNELYNFEKVSVEKVMQFYKKNYISDSIIRLLARTDPWISIYDNRKGNIFAQETEDQMRLLNYTKMYENIQEHPEAPSKEVLEDDLALDGWIIIQRRNKEKEQFKKKLENKAGKASSAQELFMPADEDSFGKSKFYNIKYAEKIDDLNDERSKSIKRSRFKSTENEEKSVMDLPDVKKKIIMEVNKNAK